MWVLDGDLHGMGVGMILGTMAITLGGAILIVIMALIGAGAGDGVVIMLVFIHLGMIRGVMEDSMAVIGEAIGDIITRTTRPTIPSRCVTMSMDDPVSTENTRLVEAAVWPVAAVD